MPEIDLTVGQLAQPACYSTEQERAEAYFAAAIGTFTGGAEWQRSDDAPTNLDLYWLKQDSDLRPVAILDYSEADGRYIRVLSIPAIDGTPATTAANAYTLSFTPSFTAATALENGRRYVFLAPATNTGAATLNIDGTGAVDIVKHGDTALAAGDIEQDQVVDVVIAGGKAWLQTPVPFPTQTELVVKANTGGLPAAGSVTTFPTTLGGAQANPSAFIVCETTEDGYAVGKKIELAYVQAGSNQPAFTVYFDDTNISIVRNSDATLRVLHATTGAYGDLTPANWSLAVRYFAIE